ncbi:MAG: hypothetical protein IH600_16425 [Bacteroidetes bacterium]|nr:hypothetical protein [Bacteroidota bacterium]
MSDPRQANHDQLIIDHCNLLATQDLRIKAVEEAVIEFRRLNAKNDERMDKHDIDIVGIQQSFHILLPIVYSILGVSVLAFLAAMFEYFLGK